MPLFEELVRNKQVAELLVLGSYFHCFKLLGNIIDGEEGVIEQRVGQLYASPWLSHLDFEVRVEELEHAKGLSLPPVARNGRWKRWSGAWNNSTAQRLPGSERRCRRAYRPTRLEHQAVEPLPPSLASPATTGSHRSTHR